MLTLLEISTIYIFNMFVASTNSIASRRNSVTVAWALSYLAACALLAFSSFRHGTRNSHFFRPTLSGQWRRLWYPYSPLHTCLPLLRPLTISPPIEEKRCSASAWAFSAARPSCRNHRTQ